MKKTKKNRPKTKAIKKKAKSSKKSSVAKKFGLDKKEIEKVRIRVKSISIGVGAILDDHAVSLHVVKPQFSS